MITRPHAGPGSAEEKLVKAGVRIGSGLLACVLVQAGLELTDHPFGLTLICGVATTIVALAAVITHARLARRTRGRSRIAWLFAAAATGMWTIGSAC
jgi:hypothetical protein